MPRRLKRSRDAFRAHLKQENRSMLNTLQHTTIRVGDTVFAASRQVWLAGLGAAVVTRDWAREAKPATCSARWSRKARRSSRARSASSAIASSRRSRAPTRCGSSTRAHRRDDGARRTPTPRSTLVRASAAEGAAEGRAAGDAARAAASRAARSAPQGEASRKRSAPQGGRSALHADERSRTAKRPRLRIAARSGARTSSSRDAR